MPRATERSARTAALDQGAAAVEFALVAGVLVLLLFAITQFGLIFYQWLEVEHAAREGARWASLENLDGTVETTGTTRYKVREAAPGLLNPITNDQIVIEPSDPGPGDVGQPVKVTISYPAPLLIPEVWPGAQEGDPMSRGLLLVGSATQRIE